jgi:hypothetical protein
MSRVATQSPAVIWDLFLAATGISLGVIGLASVNQPNLWNRWLEEPSRSTVAELVPISGTIRLKKDSFAFWQDVQNPRESHPLGDGDTLFTGPDGRAKLKLPDGTTAELQPSSLIVVHAPPPAERLSEFIEREPSAIEVRQGSLGLKLAHPRSAVRVMSRGKVLRIEASDQPAVLRLDASGPGGGVQIVAEKGSALRVKAHEGPAVVLHSGETAAVDAKSEKLRLTPLVLEPRAPRAGETRIASPGASASFSWAPLDTARISELKLELRGTATLALDADPRAGTLSAALQPGSYEWRLVATSTEGTSIESPWRSFQLIPLVAPQALAPLDGAQFTGHEAKVAFRWHPASLRSETELEITRPSDPEWKMTQKIQGQGNEVVLPEGNYEWRLRSLTGSEPSPWGTSHALQIALEKPKPLPTFTPTPVPTAAPTQAAPKRVPAAVMKEPAAPPVPRLGQPAAGGVIPTRAQVVISWATLPQADKYEFELATDPKFNHVVAHAISKANWWMADQGNSGTHFWRVRALKNGKPGPWSPPRRFMIK